MVPWTELVSPGADRLERFVKQRSEDEYVENSLTVLQKSSSENTTCLWWQTWKKTWKGGVETVEQSMTMDDDAIRTIMMQRTPDEFVFEGF